MAAVEWRATCGTKNADIKCNRPNWDKVKKAYDEINKIDENDANKVYKIIFNDEKNKLIKKGEQEWMAIQKAHEIAEKTKISQVRYEKAEGEALRYFEGNREQYRNTCALQISYALNFGGMPLHNTIKKRDFSSVGGTTIEQKETLYILGVINMREFLLQEWRQPEFKESLYEIKSYDVLLSRNKTLLQKLKDLKSKGLVTIGGGRFRDKKYLKSFWHSTLWDTNEFVDVQNDRNINYLGGIDDGVEFLAKELFFWELI
ncbi:T6SS effector amidase Tae4 family protein [Helicobacter sp. T3_23-1056]